MRTYFAKYEGAGNDFILIDNRRGGFDPDPDTIARLCDRHFGIGADGLMTLAESPEAECAMRYYNADGSEGEMCGNGARCFALFAEHLGIGGPTKQFLAADGRHTARIIDTYGTAGRIEIGMIPVESIRSEEGGWFLNTGVPHFVAFTDHIEQIDVCARGREIRYDSERFPNGTNVNFVQVEGCGRIRVRTYERGVENETLACGTGATAAAIVTNFLLQPEVERFSVALPGGRLSVWFSRKPGTHCYTEIRLEGAARRVFDGSCDLENFQTTSSLHP